MKKRAFFALAVISLLILMMAETSTAKILILAPHPDDEALMFSGVIYGALSRGEPVKVVVMTNGDLNGVSIGNIRQDETLSAMNGVLGMAESDVIFLGYPDAGMTSIYDNYPSDSDAYTAANGQRTTYGHRGLGRSDYHYYKFGTHASYNKPNILRDLKGIISDFLPDRIFVTSKYDIHPDHAIEESFIIDTLNDILKSNSSYKPIIHKTIIHGSLTTFWPVAENPATLYTPPPILDSTPLVWNYRESINVPFVMQDNMVSINMKLNTILKYSSQLDAFNYDFLTNFVHNDEIFWAYNMYSSNSPPIANGGLNQIVHEGATVSLDGISSIDQDGDRLSFRWTQLQGAPITLSDPTSPTPVFTAPAGSPAAQPLVFQLIVSDGALYSFPATVTVTVFSATQYVNVAPYATVTASSQNTSTGQLAAKAVDGVIGGCPTDCTAEWASAGELAGAWINLSWLQSGIVDKIVLFDRPELNEQILQATLTFSDGSSITIGPLANDGSGDTVTFPPKTTNSLKLTVNQATGSNAGLAEFRIFGNPAPTLAVTTTSLSSGSLSAAYSSTLVATGGVPPYTWSLTSGTLPAGLALAASTGKISGTPTATGAKTFTMQAMDLIASTSAKTLTMTVNPRLTVSTSTLPASSVNTVYSQTITATGGVNPYTWSISSGSLPAGLIINPSSGTISGTPTTEGASTFTVQVLDGNGNTATKSLSISVNNLSPVAKDDIYSTNLNSPLNQAAPGVLGNDTDPQGDPLTAQLVSGPSHGTLTLTINGSFVYTPVANFAGIDSFTYRATDGTTTSNIATVTITVGTVVFSDDFADGQLSPWTSAVGPWTVTNGVLQGAGTLMSYSHAYYAPTPLWTNYSVEGRLQFPATAFGGGIGCRLDPATGAQYIATIFPDSSPAGKNTLSLWKMWSWTTFSDAPMATATLQNVGTGWHSLKMVCNGSRIQVFYDGTARIDVIDNNYDSRPPYLSGGIGTSMYTFDNPYTMSVDNIVVTNLPGNP